MTDCTKYKVIDLYPELYGTLEIQDWLNEQFENGLELVAVYGTKFIFKKNAYLISIKKVPKEEYESH